jgi:hypothetical protein
MEVSCELHAPFALTVAKSHVAYRVGGWVGPRASESFGKQKNLLPLTRYKPRTDGNQA